MILVVLLLFQGYPWISMCLPWISMDGSPWRRPSMENSTKTPWPTPSISIVCSPPRVCVQATIRYNKISVCAVVIGECYLHGHASRRTCDDVRLPCGEVVGAFYTYSCVKWCRVPTGFKASTAVAQTQCARYSQCRMALWSFGGVLFL